MDFASYARRDWAALGQLKRDSWLRRQRARSPAQRLAAGDALRAHVRRVRPDWPSAGSRRSDLEHHVGLAARMRRAFPL